MQLWSLSNYQELNEPDATGQIGFEVLNVGYVPNVQFVVDPVITCLNAYLHDATSFISPFCKCCIKRM